MAPLYLDHHATTPVDPRVLAAMLPCFEGAFGNADSASHRYGRAARASVESARGAVASLLGARPDELVFTSGTTESNALAIAGTLGPHAGAHVVTQASEHRAVLETIAALAPAVDATVLPVDALGRVDPEAVAAAIGPRTRLVSIMLANNEIGTAQPIEAIAAICAEAGVAFHVDAAQGLGYLPLDVARTPVDLVSLSSHKIYGPQGVGALYVRRFGRAKPRALLHGGGQERGLRSGTLNVPGIVGFGAAAGLLRDEGPAEAARLGALRDAILLRLAALEGWHRHGDPLRSHPGNLSLRFDGVSAARLLVELEPELALSTGSACSSGGKPSQVLAAIGLDDAARKQTIRIGLGRGTSLADAERAAELLIAAVRRLRST